MKGQNSGSDQSGDKDKKQRLKTKWNWTEAKGGNRTVKDWSSWDTTIANSRNTKRESTQKIACEQKHIL